MCIRDSHVEGRNVQRYDPPWSEGLEPKEILLAKAAPDVQHLSLIHI